MRRTIITFLILICCKSVFSTIYYASPAGTGTGAPNSPFKIADFWKVAKPGDTLILTDGRYYGDGSMITPPEGLSGTQENPITVRAQNDGKAEIDGERSRAPVSLKNNHWFILEGFNAHSAGGSASTSVVSLSYSSNNIIRRVCAWDATDGNTNIFGIHHGSHNLLEDCAGWGMARKIFSNAQEGNYTTFRRCFGRWEGSHASGRKKVFALSYNSYHTICENCIGTWDSILMNETYTLIDYYGNPIGPIYTNYEVNMATGIFSNDDFDSGYPDNADVRILGSIAYLKPEQRYHNSFRWWFGPISLWLKGIKIENSISIIEPQGHVDIRNTYLEGGDSTNKATRLTMIGGKDVSISNQWQPSNNYRSASCSQIIANNGNILNPNISGVNTGATIMKRYVDGKLTSENLWPWPMNKRIIDAMQQSGREPIDVTKTIFELCGGTLPDEFKTNPNGSSIVEAAKDWLMNPAKRSLYEDLLKRQNSDTEQRYRHDY